MRIVLLFPLMLILTGFLSWFGGYATYCFLHVLNETSQGRKDVPVRWPGDGFYERLWTAGYLLALLLLAFLPAFFLGSVLDLLGGEGEHHSLLLALLVAVDFWLLLPVLLLSVSSSQSHWDIVRWKVLRALAGNAPMTGAFYGISAPLVVGGVVMVHFAVASWVQVQEAAMAAPLTWLPDAITWWSWLFVLPLTGAACAAGMLVYARLLGRLAWLLDLAGTEEQDEEPPVARNSAIPASSNLTVNHDTMEPEGAATTAPVETYGLQEAEPDTVLPVGPIPEREIPYPVAAPAAKPLGSAAEAVLAPPATVQASPILDTAANSPARRRLLARGVLLFPWYPASLGAWVTLTLGWLFVLLLVRLMVLVLA